MSRCGRPRGPGSGGAAVAHGMPTWATAAPAARVRRSQLAARPPRQRGSTGRSRRRAAPAGAGPVQSTIVLAAEPARGPPSRTTAACVAQLLDRLLRRRRGRAAGAVGAGHGERAGAAQQVAGDVVVGQPDGDRALGVPEVPGQGRRVLEHEGQPAGPERLRELVATGGRSTTSPASVEASPIEHRHGHVAAAVLRGEQPGHRGRGERVGGHAVDGVGGQQHQLAPADRGGGGVEAGGALRRGRSSRRGRPRASSLAHGRSGRRAVVKRGAAGEVGVVLDVGERRRARGPARAARSPCWSACSMPSHPPGRSSRAAVTSRPRTTSRPSGPPHSASGGSWSATSRGTPGAVGHVRRVGDDEVDRAVELAQQRRVGHVAGEHLDRGVARGRAGGGVVPGPLDGARDRARRR